MPPSAHRIYIYKIIPATDLPAPLPLLPPPSAPAASSPGISTTPARMLAPNYEFTPSALDMSSGYIHLSTAAQVPGTLGRFFASPVGEEGRIYLLRVELELLMAGAATTAGSGACEVKWEDSQGVRGGAWKEGCFPHAYFADGRLGLKGGEVEGVVEVVSDVGIEGWDEALGVVEEWLV